jgi:hypothetical protein
LNERNGREIRTFFRRQTASGLDAVMCALINGIQWRLGNQVCTPHELDIYFSACEPISRDQFYHVQEIPVVQRVGDYGEVPYKPNSRKIRLHAPASFLARRDSALLR